MKKIKENIKATLIIICIIIFISLVVRIKYNIWRMEHPETKTWVFFIPSRR